MLNLIGCASLRYVVIRSKSGRIRQFPGLDTPRFKEVSGDRIFLATEKVRIGENTVPDTRRTRRVSWNMILPDLPVFSKNTGPYRGISGPRHVFFHAVNGGGNLLKISDQCVSSSGRQRCKAKCNGELTIQKNTSK